MKTVMMALLLAGAAGLYADDHEDLEKAMKTAGGTMGPLRKAIEAGSYSDIGAAAKKLEGVYETTEKFWKAKGTADAIEMSATGLAAAKALGKAAAASDAEAVKAAFGKLGGTCRGCHDAHREKQADGSYKIK